MKRVGVTLTPAEITTIKKPSLIRVDQKSCGHLSYKKNTSKNHVKDVARTLHKKALLVN